MGMVRRQKTVQNIYDIPQDILVNFIGRGLRMNREDIPVLLEVFPGDNMGFDDETGALAVVNEPDPSLETHFTLLQNNSLALDGRKIALTKSYVRFKISRNCAGHVLSIEPVEAWDETDEVVLSDYGFSMAAPKSATLPHFYKT